MELDHLVRLGQTHLLRARGLIEKLKQVVAAAAAGVAASDGAAAAADAVVGVAAGVAVAVAAAVAAAVASAVAAVVLRAYSCTIWVTVLEDPRFLGAELQKNWFPGRLSLSCIWHNSRENFLFAA